MQRVPSDTRELLKGLLLHRAIRLVHVQMPMDNERKGMHQLQHASALAPSYASSFEQAEELCAKELKSIAQEFQLLALGGPASAMLEAAAQIYHSALDEAKADSDDPYGKKKKFDDIKKF